jgi:hypothetical protein
MIADAHLTCREPEDEFFRMLDGVSRLPADIGIIFLGDIFDLWIALRGYENDDHRRFLDWCRREKERRRIVFLEGNHEFFVAKTYSDAFSYSSEDSYEDGALQWLHGDRINRKDYTYTVDWAAPMSMPFFVGAAIQKQLSNKEKFDIEKLVDAFGNITEPVFNLSMLDGVNSLFKTSQYDDTDSLTQIATKIGTNYVTSYVPSLLGAVARTVDDTRRKSFVPSGEGNGVLGTIRYAREQVENKIPGLSQTNIPYRDVFGNPETSGLAERILENFILPGYVTDYKNDPVLNEMARLYDANVEDSASMVPEYPKKTVTYNKQKYTLTAEQWDTYCVERGQTAYRMLTDLIATDDYKNATPEEQIQMIKKAWTYADSVGKAAIIPGYKLEKKKDPVASAAKEGRIESNESKMMSCLESGDYDGYETMIEALHEDGVEDSTIKTKIANKYRNKYKEAYRNNDYETMSEIEDMLDNTEYDFDYYKWQEQVDDEADEED